MINLVFVSVVRFACSFGGSTPAAKAACVRLCPSKYRWVHYRQNLALRPPLFAKSPQTSTIGSDENLNACSKGRQRRSPVGLTLVSPSEWDDHARQNRGDQGRPLREPNGSGPPQLLRNPRRFRLHAVNNGDGMETGIFSRRLLSFSGCIPPFIGNDDRHFLTIQTIVQFSKSLLKLL